MKEFLIPRAWDRDTFLAGELKAGMYNASLQTSYGFPVNNDATIIVIRPSSKYFQCAFIFDQASEGTDTTKVWVNHWRSTKWSNWKEL